MTHLQWPQNRTLCHINITIIMKLIILTGVSIANAISDEFNCIDVDAHEGAKALRTLLFGKTFSLPASAKVFLFPDVK